MSGKLYIVGTPIGNLGDFSQRGIDTLTDCDFIAAEDTRVTLKLLNRFEIKKPMVSYHEHNKFKTGPQIIERIAAGENCALVTDAGMPAVSDPGEDLVRECLNAGIEVTAVPGPCAFITALALSGMPSRRFTFEGFPPPEKAERKKLFETLVNEERTVIFYEAPHRLAATLKELAAVFGPRETAVVKEITKIHEQVLRTDLVSAAEKYSAEEAKGEFVIIIRGCEPRESADMTEEEAIKYALDLVKDGISKTEAAKIASKESGFRKGDIYKKLI
ncbi:MAG: 16S rRNA (cytidine(1402)-2'-O)-methyltransferase [Clostridia bacterium]|nr:16S rRNA (cytidine(1402)-2'-O)-methyltransferase [Clostridia bacterium]